MHAQAVDTLQRRVRITLIALVLSASPTAHAAQPTTRISRLTAWLDAQPGGSLGPVRFGPSDLGGAGSGCGAFATRDLRGGELLLALPASALLTVGPDDELQSLAAELGDRAALAGTLARELLRGDASPLAAYTACLPRILDADDEATGGGDHGFADARGEGLDAETAFERLILQGEWLSMDRLARIRPR